MDTIEQQYIAELIRKEIRENLTIRAYRSGHPEEDNYLNIVLEYNGSEIDRTEVEI